MEFHPDIPISQRHLFNNSKCPNWPALSFGSKNASASLGWSSLWKYWPWHTRQLLIIAICLFLQPNFLTSWESFKAERVCETWSVCTNNPPKDIKIVPQGLRVTHTLPLSFNSFSTLLWVSTHGPLHLVSFAKKRGSRLCLYLTPVFAKTELYFWGQFLPCLHRNPS